MSLRLKFDLLSFVQSIKNIFLVYIAIQKNKKERTQNQTTYTLCNKEVKKQYIQNETKHISIAEIRRADCRTQIERKF